jgi:RNA polymerase sigma-70 factor (ECF subfamily)
VGRHNRRATARGRALYLVPRWARETLGGALPAPAPLVWTMRDPPDAPPDEALVRAAQAGDAAAFGRLYDRHFAAVYGYLAHQGVTPAEAEDLAAEVFLRALEALPGYRWTGLPVRAWLLRIARNRLVDAWRQRARRPSAPLAAAGALPDAARTADPARWLVEKVDRERLLVAVARLTTLQRQVVTLKFAGGRSNGEAAAVLGRSAGAVKALQHAALDTLRAHPPRSPALCDRNL